MALPKILGSETEYGLMVQNDPEFDSIATSLLLVNSYNADQSLKLLWDYDQEDPMVDARGFELDDEYDVPIRNSRRRNVPMSSISSAMKRRGSASSISAVWVRTNSFQMVGRSSSTKTTVTRRAIATAITRIIC